MSASAHERTARDVAPFHRRARRSRLVAEPLRRSPRPAPPCSRPHRRHRRHRRRRSRRYRRHRHRRLCLLDK